MAEILGVPLTGERIAAAVLALCLVAASGDGCSCEAPPLPPLGAIEVGHLLLEQSPAPVHDGLEVSGSIPGK